MYKIRFVLNQCGLAFEYYKEKEWRLILLIRPERIALEGIPNIKSKLLLQMTERYELVQPGEYAPLHKELTHIYHGTTLLIRKRVHIILTWLIKLGHLQNTNKR